MNQRSQPIRLLFCGADRDWAVNTREIRRRHLFFLHAFVTDPQIERIYLFQRVSRLDCLKMCWPGRRRRRTQVSPKTSTIPVVRWLPERPWLPCTITWNRAFARWLVRKQLGSSPLFTVVWCYVLRGLAIADYLDLVGDWYIDTDHDILHDPNRRSVSFAEAEALILRSVRRARWVFSASRNMLRWLRQNGVDHALRLRNGVDPERLTARAPRPPAIVSDAPVLGYVGVLSPWIDFDLLLDLAGRRPEWRFVLAGPWYRMRPLIEFQGLTNVSLRGPVAASEVPGLLTSFNIGLGLYRREAWLDVDSMKLHEYLAAGLPTVTTPFHPDLSEDFEGLVRVAGGTATFEKEIGRILCWSEARRQRFLNRSHDFATSHSWDIRTDEALAIIKASPLHDIEE